MKLSDKKCTDRKGENPMSGDEAQSLLAELTLSWQLGEHNQTISHDFKFDNFYKTISFVNAIAWIANQQDHHPDLEVGYGHCLVRFSTHSIDGLSENDFICAAKIEQLLN